jgi:isopropylmalate/homocitrate/citramalate synthase
MINYLEMKEIPDFPLEEPYYADNVKWTSKFNFDFEDKSVKPDYVEIHDVTLRDGDQTPGVVLLEDERVRIADALAEMKVPRIEAGMPVVSAQVENAMRRMVAKKYPSSKVFAFCRAVVKDVALAVDIGCQGVIIEYCVNPYTIKYSYKDTPQKLIDKLTTAVNYAKENGLYVSFMGWDWFRTPVEFTRWIVSGLYEKTALDGLVMVDTYGCATPDAVEGMFKRFKEWFPRLRLEFHGHNDIGCGNANCLAAIRGGAEVIHSAINGLGERGGNVATEEMVVVLEIHKGINTGIQLNKIMTTCEVTSKIAKIPLHSNKSVVGDRPYQSESGIAMDIAYKLAHNGAVVVSNYMTPVNYTVIGRSKDVEFVLGKSSGKNSVRLFLDKYGMEATTEQVVEILDRIVAEAFVTKDLVSEETFLKFAKDVIGEK